MSNHNFDRPWCLGKRKIDFSGSFVPLTGAGTIDATKVTGLGFGFAFSQVTGVVALRSQPANNPTPNTTPGILRTGTGLYVVTFDDTYQDVDAVSVDLAAPVSGSALWAQAVEPIANLATANKGPALSILIVNNAGTPTDAAANMRLHFIVVFRDSTVQRAKP